MNSFFRNNKFWINLDLIDLRNISHLTFYVKLTIIEYFQTYFIIIPSPLVNFYIHLHFFFNVGLHVRVFLS